MLKKIAPFLFLLLFFGWAQAAQAGFGVSPPRVKNHQLTPGSTYPVKIMLLRSSAEEDLKAVVKVSAPEIESWIKIDKGEEFILPKGELQVPMTVTFEIPKNAELGNYTGNLNIKVLPGGEKASGVSIALGARVDIDLALTNVSNANFLVRLVSVPDFEMLGSPWNWKIWSKVFNPLFYHLRVVMNVENTGNVKTAPSKVGIEIYDINKNGLLEEREDKTLNKVKPFSVGEIVADFPTKLASGQYWAKIKVYKENEIVNFYEIAFSVEKPGVLGAGARSLGVWPWLTLAGLILSVVLIVVVLIKIRFWRFFFFLILLPTKPLGKGAKNVVVSANRRFWQWVNKQAERHKE
jgi:hypothetical protein